MARLDDLGVYSVKLTTGEELSFRRMSEREIDDFARNSLPWIYEQTDRLIRELNRDAYTSYCRQLEEVFVPLVADADPKSGVSASVGIIQEFKKDARRYRFDALNLFRAIMRQEGLDASAAPLPQPEAVDDLPEEELVRLGEGSPPSSQARSTSRSGSRAATRSNGSPASTVLTAPFDEAMANHGIKPTTGNGKAAKAKPSAGKSKTSGTSPGPS